MGRDRQYSVRKSKAEFYPQVKCRFFAGDGEFAECVALTKPYCMVEAEKCKFFRGKGGCRQTDHIPTGYTGRGISESQYRKAEYMWYIEDLTWKEVSERTGISMPSLRSAREKYPPKYAKPPKNPNAFPEATLRKAMAMYQDGMSWNYIGKKLGHSGAAIKDRIDKDRSRGIYHLPLREEE